jgi:flagella basal body P-ring formation protein FlgA
MSASKQGQGGVAPGRAAHDAPLAFLLALTLAAPAIAAPHEDPARVAAVVSQAAAQLVPPGAVVVLGPVGGAAVMARCPGALSAVVTGVAPYEQAAVRCAGLGWTLFVSLTVTQSAQVVVAARPVAAGQALGPADVVLRSEDVSAYAGRRVFYNLADVLGADPLMNLAAGAILTANAVETPVLVKAGQTVAVQVKAGAVEVSVNAVADETGRAGDEVMFTNPATGKRFEALLTAAGPVLQL